MHEPWVPLLNGQILARSLCPVVATFHAKLPDSAAAKALTAFGRPYTVPPLKYLDAIVAVSEAAAEHVRLLTKEPVYIIPNAVMIEDFRPKITVRPNAKKTLLYVGRLEERKGVAHLIAAYKQLRETDKNVRLIIAGDGVQRVELEEMVAYENIKGVTFLGYVSDSKKKQLMRAADLFVAPAVFGESFGIVIIEALASGQVLVVGDNEGYRSVMHELGQISLVDPTDVAQFADRMQLLLHDEELRAVYKRWGARYIEQFDYKIVTAQYVTLYEQVLSHSKQPATLEQRRKTSRKRIAYDIET
jgi:phosphatidylinositol alpha-mannosyltransferase